MFRPFSRKIIFSFIFLNSVKRELGVKFFAGDHRDDGDRQHSRHHGRLHVSAAEEGSELLSRLVGRLRPGGGAHRDATPRGEVSGRWVHLLIDLFPNLWL